MITKTSQPNVVVQGKMPSVKVNVKKANRDACGGLYNGGTPPPCGQRTVVGEGSEKERKHWKI